MAFQVPGYQKVTGTALVLAVAVALYFQASKAEQPEGDRAGEEVQPLNVFFLLAALVFILALPCTLPLNGVISNGQVASVPGT